MRMRLDYGHRCEPIAYKRYISPLYLVLPSLSKPSRDQPRLRKGRPSYPKSVFYGPCIIYCQNEGHSELWVDWGSYL